MKIKIKKTDRGRPPPTVSLCPYKLNPTVDDPHQIGRSELRDQNRPRRGRCVLSVFSAQKRSSTSLDHLRT
jgi:hypothetical protein